MCRRSVVFLMKSLTRFFGVSFFLSISSPKRFAFGGPPGMCCSRQAAAHTAWGLPEAPVQTRHQDTHTHAHTHADAKHIDDTQCRHPSASYTSYTHLIYHAPLLHCCTAAVLLFCCTSATQMCCCCCCRYDSVALLLLLAAAVAAAIILPIYDNTAVHSSITAEYYS